MDIVDRSIMVKFTQARVCNGNGNGDWQCYWDIYAVVISFIFCICSHNWKLASDNIYIVYSTNTPHTYVALPVFVSVVVCFAFTIAFYVRAAHLFFRFGFLYNIVYCCYSPPTLRPTINGLLRNQITNKHSHWEKQNFTKSNTNKLDNYEKLLPSNNPPRYILMLDW